MTVDTTAVPVTLADDWAAEYRGVVIGSPGSPLTFTEISGLLDAPALRTADRATLNRHGEVSGRDYLGPRTVVITLELNARDSGEFADQLDAVTAAFAPAQPVAPFRFRFPGVAGGGVRLVNAKVRKRAITIDTAYTHHYATVTVELYCPSPLILDVAKSTGYARLPNLNGVGGGIRFPIRFPVRFGRSVSTPTIVARNSGTFDTYPTFRIRGPIADPRIVNVGTGEQLEFRYVLLRGQWLDVNTDTRDVLLNGSAPRFLTPGLRNTWLSIPPGVSEFGLRGFRLPDETVEPELTGDWYSAWV
ncbi:MAG: hypothetical protein ABIQ18_35865 [Umezawaea sp.]